MELLDSITSGGFITEKMKKYKDDRFHMMEYRVPDKGRFVLYEDKVETYEELLNNIRQWNIDTTLEFGSSSIKFITNIYAVFESLINNKEATDTQKAINGQFGSIRADFVKAVMFGIQIPKQLYNDAQHQVVRSVLNGFYNPNVNTAKKDKIIKYYSPKTALRIIKAYLIRKGYKMSENLNTENTNPGYLCGRLLAILEKVQIDASKTGQGESSLNITLAEKMYKGITKEPGRIISECLSDRMHYYKKLRGRNQNGKVVFYEQIIADILGMFGDKGIPKKLTDDEIGHFHIAYAIQRQELYKKRVKEKESFDEIQEIESPVMSDKDA